MRDNVQETASANFALLLGLERVLKAQGKELPPTDLASVIVDLTGCTTGTVIDTIGNLLAIALRGDALPWESRESTKEGTA